jgi:transposase
MKDNKIYKIKKAPDPKLSYYKCIKTSLKSVVKDERIVKIINDTVIMSNKIIIHSLQFMKLYLLHLHDNNKSFPKMNRQFINSIMKIVCIPPTRGKKPSASTLATKNELNIVYDKYYKDIQLDTLNYRHMNTILEYLVVDILTMYENNIKQRFVEYIERFVNVIWKKKQLVKLMKTKYKTKKTRQSAISKLCNQLRKIKNDILSINKEKTSSPIYHQWIDYVRTEILPQKTYQKDLLYYDLQCSPQDYFPSMMKMMKIIEQNGEHMNNLFPLRTDIIPKYIRIDTTSLMHLFFTKEQGRRDFYLRNGNMTKYQDKLWKLFFRLDKKCFHSEDDYNYHFHHMIETDGIGCSILLLREDLEGKKLRQPKVLLNREKYIDELTTNEKQELQKKKVVAIDPNMSDLIYCIDGLDKTSKTFRYTQNQRRKETKAKKYRNFLQANKNSTKIEGQTITEWEAKLSQYNRKTLDFSKFMEYIKEKNIMNKAISSFYQGEIYRKLKLHSFINKKKTEQKMMNRFMRMFGTPEEVVIGFGDFEQAQHRKYKEPVKGKGFRTLFRKAGYQVYLVDEFRTSCRCSHCAGETSTFRECINPRPWKDNIIMRHGLVKCKTCSRLWNRDTNASINIYKIIVNEIQGQERPTYLTRTKGSISGAPSVST